MSERAAVVELPDDAIEALIEEAARQRRWSVQGVTGGPLYDSSPEWQKAEYRRAVEQTVRLVAARVRAEAVADERRRIADQIERRKSSRFSNLGNSKFNEGWHLALDAVSTDLAAGSVPAATEPQRIEAIEWEAVISQAVQGRRPSDTVAIAAAVRSALLAAGSETGEELVAAHAAQGCEACQRKLAPPVERVGGSCSE